MKKLKENSYRVQFEVLARSPIRGSSPLVPGIPWSFEGFSTPGQTFATTFEVHTVKIIVLHEGLNNLPNGTEPGRKIKKSIQSSFESEEN